MAGQSDSDWARTGDLSAMIIVFASALALAVVLGRRLGRVRHAAVRAAFPARDLGDRRLDTRYA